MKAPSPLLGFNNNVRHKGRVFHIQTEDSGIRHPHIITHLFADGGRILKTTKTSYAEHVGQERLAETVRAMMQEQHKAMFMALRDGQFDYLFEEGGPHSPAALKGAKVSSSAEGRAVRPPSKPALEAVPAPVAAAVPPPPPPPATRPSTPTARAPIASAPVLSPVDAGPPPSVTDPEAPPSRRVGRPRLDVDPAAIHGVSPHKAEPAIDLDLDALERAAAEAQTPFFQQMQDLPPPPPSVLGSRRQSTGGYSVRSPAPPQQAPARPAARATAPASVPMAPPPPGRYAPSRPASIFATTRPQEGASIFGEDLISEKSLDEVILSYLAEDLDGPAEKK